MNKKFVLALLLASTIMIGALAMENGVLAQDNQEKQEKPDEIATRFDAAFVKSLQEYAQAVVGNIVACRRLANAYGRPSVTWAEISSDQDAWRAAGRRMAASQQVETQFNRVRDALAQDDPVIAAMHEAVSCVDAWENGIEQALIFVKTTNFVVPACVFKGLVMYSETTVNF